MLYPLIHCMLCIQLIWIFNSMLIVRMQEEGNRRYAHVIFVTTAISSFIVWGLMLWQTVLMR